MEEQLKNKKKRKTDIYYHSYITIFTNITTIARFSDLAAQLTTRHLEALYKEKCQFDPIIQTDFKSIKYITFYPSYQRAKSSSVYYANWLKCFLLPGRR